MSYTIRIKQNAQKSLAKISQPYQAKIIGSIRNLSNEPRPSGCKKLIGRDAWRIRVGDYRVIYEITDNELVILIVHIGHRRKVYKIES
ncbi:type II toxin-antitoxin system RelE family toxin [Candidatus Thiosymbion oneisti]|uniref:type II toxin-antitoxin system RelE family toxin n=1 Tax=Candidatus Thiosymbion oneisti TaxID=589554 RepID=UPI000B7FBABD|nr:type II toxin-antitoxin system RelE/ParE family toxin [Candidatus Thiosymbion oneisti]